MEEPAHGGRRLLGTWRHKAGLHVGHAAAVRRYALSLAAEDPALLLLKILVPSLVSSGADLGWVSAFTHEGDVLFPPLTFLLATGRVDRLGAQCGCLRVRVTVVEVVPHVADRGSPLVSPLGAAGNHLWYCGAPRVRVPHL